MKEVFYVFKIFVVSMVLILFLQIRIGNSTLENHAHLFIQESWVTEQVQLVADGGAKLVKTVTQGISQKLGGIFKKSARAEEKKRLDLNFAQFLRNPLRDSL